MKRYSLTHLSDDALLRDLSEVIARERSTTAEAIAHIAEVDARRLYRGAAYPSMFASVKQPPESSTVVLVPDVVASEVSCSARSVILLFALNQGQPSGRRRMGSCARGMEAPSTARLSTAAIG